MGNNTQDRYYESAIYSNNENIRYTHNPIVIANIITTIKKEEFPKTTNIYCTHCDLNFINLTEYEHHNITMHGQAKPIRCEICNTEFKRRDHLKRHLHSLHGDQKFYNCPVCGVDCTNQDNLLQHIGKEHNSDTEIFQCRECKYHCDSLGKLEKHELTHLIRDRHICTHCKATFKRRDHMLRHVKSQHLNQSVVCPLCYQTYKRRDHLIRHVREKHKMGYLDGKLVKSADIIQ